MINTTKDLIFLKTGQELSDICHSAFKIISSTFREDYDYVGPANSITAFENQAPAFIKFFSPEYSKEIGLIDDSAILKLYKLTSYSSSMKPSNNQMKEFCLYQLYSALEAPTKSYFPGIKLGVQLLFLYLWKEKVILLPYSFQLPDPYSICNSSDSPLYRTTVSSFIRNLHQKYGATDIDLLKKYDLTAQALDNSSRHWIKLCFSTTWYQPCDISIDDLVKLRKQCFLSRQGKGVYTTSPPRTLLLIRILLDTFSSQLSFDAISCHKSLAEEHLTKLNDTSDNKKIRRHNAQITREASLIGLKKHNVPPIATRNYHGTINEKKAPKDKLEVALSSIFLERSSIKKSDLIKRILELVIKDLGRSIFLEAYQRFSQKQYLKAAEYWFNTSRAWLKKKKYSNPDQADAALGYFNAYLFIYLPWWYANNQHLEKLPIFPDTANNLNGSIFIASLEGQNDNLPMSYVEFMEEIAITKNWANETLHSHMNPLLVYFRWISGKRNRLAHANQFEIPLDNDDLPTVKGYGQSQKKPLPRRLFKLFIRYCYALEGLQKELMERVEDGELDPKEMSGVGTYINLVDHADPEKVYHFNELGSNAQRQQPIRDLDLTRYRLSRPVVTIDEREYQISSFYRFFYHDTYLISETEEKTLIYPGDLYICQLLMETGIRAKHLRWLDLDSFDCKVDYMAQEEYLHPLWVNTDKVKKTPWVSTVSSIVIKLCNNQKIWRNKIYNPSFHKEIFYNGNKASAFGAFKPLFSQSPKAGTPGTRYEETWLNLMLGFQQFLTDHGIKSEPLIKIKPVGCKYKESISPDKIEIRTGSNGEFCQITYAKHSTPHSARNSVVGENTRFLPPHIVGEKITGQKERLVWYYNLRDTEEHYADQALQWVDHAQQPIMPKNEEQLKRLMTPADTLDGTMTKGIRKDPEQSIDAYGLICINLITDNDGNMEDGINMLKAKKGIALAVNSTHYCPFGNICPAHIVRDFGEFKACAICPYAISGVNHLPAISAAKDAKYEQLAEEKIMLQTLRRETPDALDMITEQDDLCSKLTMHAAGWEYREKEIFRKVEGIKKGFDEGIFTVGKPEFIANLLERTVMKEGSDETAYLIKRLRDCKAFPLMETPQISAKFNFARRKLMAAKDINSLLNNEPTCPRPVAELYSLIHSYKELHNINNQTINRILSATPLELIELGPKLLLEQA